MIYVTATNICAVNLKIFIKNESFLCAIAGPAPTKMEGFVGYDQCRM